MQPEIDLFGLPIKTFGLMLALGFVASGAVLSRRLDELRRPADHAYEMIFAALIGGLVGSRLYWVAEHTSEIDGIGDLVAGTGLVWYGGALGGAICVLAWAWWRGVFGVTVFDLAAAPLAVGYAIGRIGCQLSGDGDYGQPWDGPWAMAYPEGTVPTDVPVHPTPVYETVAMCLAAWVLWRLRDVVRPGVVFGAYLVLAGTERFLVELIRRNEETLAGLTTPQVQSLALVAGGVVWLWVVARRGGLRAEPPAGRAARVPATA